MNLLVSMRYLVALDEHQHFARAAQACFVTQPALSNAIRALEEEYGAVLVKRSRTFAGFTPEGQRMLASARRLLHEQELLAQDFKSSQGKPAGTLALGAVPSAEPIAARFAAMLQARHPGIRPVVRIMSSPDIEAGLENLSLDLGLGFTDRPRPATFLALPQYAEHYFWVSKADTPTSLKTQTSLHIGQPMTWQEAAQSALCLMTPEMHNRRIVDAAFAKAGTTVTPVMETSSVLTLALSLMSGSVSCIMPGALVGAFRAHAELQARSLVSPELHTPVGFMALKTERTPRTLDAALTLAQDAAWLRHAAAHSGLLAA
jgi:DNA-binding transcriptional LysR family regulator